MNLTRFVTMLESFCEHFVEHYALSEVYFMNTTFRDLLYSPRQAIGSHYSDTLCIISGIAHKQDVPRNLKPTY